MAIFIFFSVKTCKQNVSDKVLLENTLDSTYSVAKYYKNKNGDFVGQVKAQAITIGQLEEYGTELGIDNDRLKKQIGSLSNLVTYWKGRVVASETIKTTLIDTVYLDAVTGMEVNKSFKWSNKYLFLDGSMNTLTNDLSIDYKYNMDFEFTSYYKPRTFREKVLFKPKQLVGDLYMSDPNLRVTEFKGIVIQQQKFNYKPSLIFGGAGFILGFLVGSK